MGGGGGGKGMGGNLKGSRETYGQYFFCEMRCWM